MQKELIISIVIIIAIIIINVVANNYTEKSVHYLDDKLDEIKQLSLEDNENNTTQNKDKIQEKIRKFREDWSKINASMALYIEHDELEKVNTSLVILEQNLILGEYVQGIAELENCKYILNHIEDKESMRIINLF